MALIHDFFLIRNDVEPTLFVRKSILNEINIQDYVIDKVHIDDNIILFMIDTLRWIPTKNPGKKGLPPSEGLCYYGFTLFDRESSCKLKSVFSAWKSLFENAPETIEISNNFSEEDDDRMLRYKKDELLFQFSKIISFSEKIAGDNYLLYHWGI